MIKRLYEYILILVVALFVSGCSLDQDLQDPLGETNRENGNISVENESVIYQVKQNKLDLNEHNFAAYAKQNGKLYMLGYIGDYETKQLNYSLMLLNDQGSMEEVTAITGMPNYMVRELAVDSNENFWGIASSTTEDAQEDASSQHLIQFDKNGTILYDQTLKDLANPIKSVTYSHLFSDNRGTLFLMEKSQQGESRVLILGEDGKIRTTISVSEQTIGLVQVSDSIIYTYAMDNKGSIQVYEMETDTGVLKAEGSTLAVTDTRRLFGGMNGEILAVTDSALWNCTLDGGEPVKLFEWLDKGIDISKWMSFLALSKEKIVGIGQGLEGQELLQVTEEQRDISQEIKVLTVASLQADDKLKQEIVIFNQNHSDCVMKLEEYYKPYVTGATIEDAVDRLNTDLLSGNAGDLIDIKSLSEVTPARFYVKRGMLENLYDWMENDSTINRDLYTAEVWKANEIEGGLYSLVPSFSLSTMMGRTSQVGEGFSWSPKKMQETLDTYGELPLYVLETRESFLKYICQYDIDEFVNWEMGECNFSNEDFSIFLEYAKSLPESVNETEIDSLNEIYFKKALLYDELKVGTTLFDYLIAKNVFGEEVSLIGFPVSEGIGCLIEPGISLAISSKSSQKEAAWEAIRYFLSEDYQYNLVNRDQRSDFPIMDKARTYGYERVMKDEVQAKSSMGNSYGGWNIEVGYPTEQDIDEVEALIHAAAKIKEMDQTIYTIITEEAAAYFSGQRELDEVVHLIQNRVSIYVKENA